VTAAEEPRTCGARPIHGTARCNLPAGHDGKHFAPLAVGGNLTFEKDHRQPWERP
jgi:hypothetical protein